MEQLNWHTELPNVSVTYSDGLPSTQFFSNIKKNSLVVVDDLYEECINSSQIARAFKYDRRHNKFSILLVTQSLYEKGKWAKSIRNNTEIFVLFRNFGLVALIKIMI